MRNNKPAEPKGRRGVTYAQTYTLKVQHLSIIIGHNEKNKIVQRSDFIRLPTTNWHIRTESRIESKGKHFQYH